MTFPDENRMREFWQTVKNKIDSLIPSITTAQQTANTAAEAAGAAQSSADNAQSTANAAKTTAEAALPKSGGVMTGPITGITTPAVDTGAANKLYVDSSIIRPNLLHNWYFVNSVNQRGLTNYTQDGYTIDRWKIENAEIELSNNCILLKSKSADGFGDLYQIIENYNDIKGKNATFSILSDNKILEYHFTIGGQPAPVIDSQNTNIQVFSIDARHILIRTHSRDTFEMSAVKLELGSTQTLAHKEGDAWVLNEIPDYATELMKCQRYLYVFPAESVITFSAVSVFFARDWINFNIYLPVAMRSNPIANLSNILIVPSTHYTFADVTPVETGAFNCITNNNLCEFSVNIKDGTNYEPGVYIVKLKNDLILSAEL